MQYRDSLYGNYVNKFIELNEPINLTSLKWRSQLLEKTIIEPFFPKDRNVRILDLGCGYGSLLYACAYSGYKNLLGIDNSPEQVALAKKMGIAEIGRIIQKDFLKYMELAKQDFDVITAIDVLEHLTKEEVIVLTSLVFTALKPGGLFIIRSVNGESPFMGRWLYGDFTHELCFTRISLKQILGNVGFDEIHCYEITPMVHGFLSGVRAVLWLIIARFLRFCAMVENGNWRDRPIFSYNLVAVAHKGGNDNNKG